MTKNKEKTVTIRIEADEISKIEFCIEKLRETFHRVYPSNIFSKRDAVGGFRCYVTVALEEEGK